MTGQANPMLTHPRYTAPMPTTEQVASGHTGIAKVRTGPELSDLALFAVACLAVWLVRRALRRRFAARKD